MIDTYKSRNSCTACDGEGWINNLRCPHCYGTRVEPFRVAQTQIIDGNGRELPYIVRAADTPRPFSLWRLAVTLCFALMSVGMTLLMVIYIVIAYVAEAYDKAKRWVFGY